MENDKFESAREKLRIKFHEETNMNAYFEGYGYGQKYPEWLENFILNQSSSEALTLADNEAKEKVCLHLITYVDHDNFIKCQDCDQIVDA
jgi:hypothetical protein